MTCTEKECYRLHRLCVGWGLGCCEMCGAIHSLSFSVHHPIKRDQTYRFDLRNGICLCQECHELYDHNLAQLLVDMRERGMHEHADWLERHDGETHPQAKAWIDPKAKRDELKAALDAIQSGRATRDEFRDWGHA